MHDAATVDLLIRLAAERAERGVLGSIRAFSGTCFFLDRNILKFAGPAIDLIIEQTGKGNKLPVSRQQRRQEERKGAAKVSDASSSMKSLIAAIEMPSAFVLTVIGR